MLETGNIVKEARVSESTRRDARGEMDRGSWESEVSKLGAEIQAEDTISRDAQLRLAEINSEIRGKRLPQQRYDYLQSQQVVIKRQITNATNKSLALKDRLRALKSDGPAESNTKSKADLAPEEGFDIATFDCGTSACAVGWFCRANPSDELHLIPDDYGGLVRLRGKKGCSITAICQRFGIEYSDTTFLFYGNEGREESRSAVIARIEQFIAEHEAPS